MSDDDSNDYVTANLPPAIVEKLEAGAFQALVEHLKERSNEVPNIDLMTVSGFCRNCLAKWLVVEARKMAADDTSSVDADIIRALNSMGYDEAAQHVYGMEYPEWKKRHASKASDEQMERFNASKPLWAKHNKEILQKRETAAPVAVSMANEATSDPTAQPSSSSLLSNVCCQPMDEVPAVAQKQVPNQQRQQQPTAQLPASLSFTLGILTVSDRASAGEYQDLSGPAVERTLKDVLLLQSSHVQLTNVSTAIVPDEVPQIQQTLKEWSGSVDLILTTGGTGFAPRDVTPEATKAVLDVPCEGLLAYVTMECSKMQPMAALSRGTAGILNNTLIFNLPGNPKGVQEIIPTLLPLALHAVADIKSQS